MDEQKNSVLFYFVVALLVVSVVVFSMNLFKVLGITGRATGVANLTVETRTQINFTTNSIEWGSGSVTPGGSSATLDTSAGGSAVVGGNWTANTAGFVIENIGNQNVSIKIAASKTNATLLGGTSPTYEYNVSSIETGSCVGADSQYRSVNITGSGTLVCNPFYSVSTKDTMRVDIKLVVPDDSSTGVITDTILLTATAV